MAALRNLVITALRLAGTTNIAAALRHHARNPHHPLATYKIATLPQPWFPPASGTSRRRLPRAAPPCCDRTAAKVSHLHSNDSASRRTWIQAQTPYPGTPPSCGTQVGGNDRGTARDYIGVGISGKRGPMRTRARAAVIAAATFAGLVFGTSGTASADTTFFGPGSQLDPCQTLSSPNGDYQLNMQCDGNLTLNLLPENRQVWASGTGGMEGSVLQMQGDGNAVVYSPGHIAQWESHTAGNPGSTLAIQDDGNLVVVAPGNHPIWSTGTVGAGQYVDTPKPPPASADSFFGDDCQGSGRSAIVRATADDSGFAKKLEYYISPAEKKAKVAVYQYGAPPGLTGLTISNLSGIPYAFQEGLIQDSQWHELSLRNNNGVGYPFWVHPSQSANGSGRENIYRFEFWFDGSPEKSCNVIVRDPVKPW
jgi:hypothetical protein